MSEVLIEESKSKAETQKKRARDTVDQLMAEVVEAAEKVDAIREKIAKGHLSSDGDCFFKSNQSQYEKCVPKINVEDLKKLLERDVEECQEVPDRVEANLELVQ